MYKIGIIGCGKIAQVRHIPEYMANSNTELAGFYDLRQDRAQELATKFGVKAYDSYEAMLKDPSIDAVSVCSANHTHASITIEALRAGKHVLCEKPMAITLEECEEMVRVAKEEERFLMIGHNQRLTKAHRRARQLIEEGSIGEIISFRTTFGHKGPETWSIDPGKNIWFFDKDLARLGAVGDLGIHKTDVIQFLTGQKITEVMAKIVTLDKKDAEGNLIGVDDNAISIYTMENGIVGTMTASWTYYGKEDNATVLYGTKGIMHIYDDPTYSITITTKEGENIYYEIDKIQTNDHQTASGVIDLFAQCLVTQESQENSGEQALAAMKAVFASVESSRTGKAVKIK